MNFKQITSLQNGQVFLEGCIGIVCLLFILLALINLLENEYRLYQKILRQASVHPFLWKP